MCWRRRDDSNVKWERKKWNLKLSLASSSPLLADDTLIRFIVESTWLEIELYTGIARLNIASLLQLDTVINTKPNKLDVLQCLVSLNIQWAKSPTWPKAWWALWAHRTIAGTCIKGGMDCQPFCVEFTHVIYC